MPPTGKIIISAVALFTSTMCFVADFNHTHIYNPRWPPHAKFHTGQTMSMGLVLGLLTQFILWRPSPKPTALSARLEKERVQHAALVASLYWVTQASAILYPGTATMDPEFGDGGPQMYLSGGLLTIVALGYWLGVQGLENNGAKSA